MQSDVQNQSSVSLGRASIIRSPILWLLLPYVLGYVAALSYTGLTSGVWGDNDWQQTFVPVITFFGMLPTLPIVIVMFIKGKTIRIEWIYGFIVYIAINIALVAVFTEGLSHCC